MIAWLFRKPMKVKVILKLVLFQCRKKKFKKNVAVISSIKEQLSEKSKHTACPTFKKVVLKALESKDYKSRTIPNRKRLSQTDIFDPCDSSSNKAMTVLPKTPKRELIARDVSKKRGTKRKQLRSIRKYRKRRLV